MIADDWSIPPCSNNSVLDTLPVQNQLFLAVITAYINLNPLTLNPIVILFIRLH